MSASRVGLVGRLALTMGTIAIAAVAVSMLLVYHALDGRLNRLAQAHVQSSAVRVAALAADSYGGAGWSPGALRALVERTSVAGFDITLTDPAGRTLTASPGAASPHRWEARAPILVQGRAVGQLELHPVRTDIFGVENRALHRQLNGLLEVCAALALGLALLAAAIVATTLVRPLHRLTETAERMSRGDLTARARVRGGSELEQLAAAFNQLASTLAREDELRRAAAADIAHELRTPVAGIVSRIEAAQDGVMDDAAANLEAMHAEALRLAHLIDDVGKLAEAERADLLIAREPLDVADVGKKRAAAYEGFFAAKGIAFAAHLQPAPVRGDARRLEQVVDNLLSNALRYTDPGGSVATRAAAWSRSATRASASTPRTSRTCSTASGAATARARAPPAARASASPWCASWSAPTTATSSCGPRSAAARPRASCCPRAPPSRGRPSPPRRPGCRRRRARRRADAARE